MFQTVAAALLLALFFAAHAKVSVAAFGDSLMAGYQLQRGEGFVPALQRYLDGIGIDAEVLDFANSGDTTADGLNRIAEVEKARPQVVLLGLGSNDALRHSSAGHARSNLDAMITRLQAGGMQVLLLGALAPFNYGPAYKSQFDRIYAELADDHDVELYPFILEGVALDPRYILADGLHPNPAGVAIMVERIGPLVAEMVERSR